MSDSNDVNIASAGTRFPFINLKKALDQAKKLFDADQKGREMPIAAAFAVWDYSEKSSGGFQTIAALKMYGLLQETEGSDTRKITLSEPALRYFRDEREDEKLKLAREFAGKPKLIAALWRHWIASPPADPIARSHLKAERGLSDQGARSLLSIYKENLAFVKLTGDDISPERKSEPEPKPASPSFDVFNAMFDQLASKREQKMQQPSPENQTAPSTLMPVASSENDIKIMLDGDRLRISAYVNLKGAKRLLKALKANMALLEDDEGNAESGDDTTN